jgi:D-alanyl-D-alanine carboxypeptidase
MLTGLWSSPISRSNRCFMYFATRRTMYVSSVTMKSALDKSVWQMHSFVVRHAFSPFAQIKWVKDLKESEEYHKSGAHHHSENTQIQTTTVRTRYRSPYPGFADREFLMTKVRTLHGLVTNLTAALCKLMNRCCKHFAENDCY